MHAVTGGRYEATCGRCLKNSIAIPATSPANAWTDLVRLGWSHCFPEGNRTGYALCPTCTKEPFSVEDAVKKAHKKRKKR